MCRGNLKKLSCKACTSIVCFEEKSLAVEAATGRTNCVAAAAQETGSMGGDKILWFCSRINFGTLWFHNLLVSMSAVGP